MSQLCPYMNTSSAQLFRGRADWCWRGPSHRSGSCRGLGRPWHGEDRERVLITELGGGVSKVMKAHPRCQRLLRAQPGDGALTPLMANLMGLEEQGSTLRIVSVKMFAEWFTWREEPSEHGKKFLWAVSYCEEDSKSSHLHLLCLLPDCVQWEHLLQAPAAVPATPLSVAGFVTVALSIPPGTGQCLGPCCPVY